MLSTFAALFLSVLLAWALQAAGIPLVFSLLPVIITIAILGIAARSGGRP